MNHTSHFPTWRPASASAPLASRRIADLVAPALPGTVDARLPAVAALVPVSSVLLSCEASMRTVAA